MIRRRCFVTARLLNTRSLIQPEILASPNLPSALAEQRAILDACLAGGQLARAKTLWTRIKQSHQSDQAKIADAVPITVHAAFLRAFFRSALSARSQNAFVRHLDEAWDWWHMLVNEADVLGKPLPSSFAVMLKGAVAFVFLVVAKSKQFDNISLLLEQVSAHNIPLVDVLRDPIFESQAPAVLGDVSVTNAIELLESVVTSQQSPNLAKLLENAQVEFEANDAISTSIKHDPLLDVPKLDPTLRALSPKAMRLTKTPRTDEDQTAVPARLDTLRDQLTSITEKRSSLSDPYARQRLLEESAYDAARRDFDRQTESLRALPGVSPISQDDDLKRLCWRWINAMVPEIQESAKDSKAEEATYLSQIDPERAAFIAISELLPLIVSPRILDGTTIALACVTIGKAIEREYRAELFNEADPKAFADLLRRSKLSSGPAMRRKTLNELWKDRLATDASDASVPDDWSVKTRVRVGASLVAALIQTSKVVRSTTRTIILPSKEIKENVIREEQPAFFHSYQFIKGQKIGILRANPAVAERLRRDPALFHLAPRQLPMVVPPRIWQDWNIGCYMVQPVAVVRTGDSVEQLTHVKNAAAQGQLETLFSGLDALGSTPWSVNRKIFDVVSTVWNNDIELAGMPAKDPMLRIKDPEKPKASNDGFEDLAARELHRQRVRQVANLRASAHSDRCSINYQLEIARAFLGETMYFPHNVDFRGRAYPIPPNFSHIGNDLARSLLQFGRAKPLGESGLRWLRIHLANTFGFDKASLDERALFSEQHMDDIYDSADHPLEGRRWWAQAEDPWQCLAACYEVTAALRSGDPQTFESSLPVHQDGTCNGLQHYAALGGDKLGAKTVNLVKGDRPADIYGHVARLASAIADKDAANGHPQALQMKGKITRKVVKQTVMTTVYGVTYVGAIRQIAKQLEALKLVPDEDVRLASIYTTKITLKCIGDLFAGASALRKWLTQTTNIVCRSLPPVTATAKEVEKKAVAKGRKPKSNKTLRYKTAMIWTSPLGLPVVQPYRKSSRKQISTVLQSIYLDDPTVPTEVDPAAQSTAFPPNFVHSLDATHMMLTAIECKNRDIVFASVHDSFWTHAADVDDMSRVLRQAFIDLHTKPLLENLKREILTRFAGYRVPLSSLPKLLKSKLMSDAPKRKQPSKTKDPIADSFLDDLEPNLLLSDSNSEQLDLTDEQIQALRPNIGTAQGEGDSSDTDSIALVDLIPDLPTRGDFDLRQVADSPYFFS